MTTVLRNATLADGRRVDVRLEDSKVAQVSGPSKLRSPPGVKTLELDGYVLLPALAEPHTHLDKALTADRFGREFPDLPSAIAAWRTYRSSLGVSDIVERAKRTALLALAHGATAIRTHADVGAGIELRAVEALVQVRDALRSLVDIQIVALVYPLTGVAGARNRSLLREALHLGADIVGGAPHIDPDPPGHVAACLDIGAEFGCPVDLHADENLDPDSADLVELTQQVATGFPHPVTASHCVTLGVQPPDVQAARALAVATSGVSVVTLPIANLYLQGRGMPMRTPRGLTAIVALLGAGVTVAGGGDNVQDPFIPVGHADPLVTAQYLVVAGQLATNEALELVTGAARRVMGLPPIEVSPGSGADLVAVAGSSLRETIASAAPARLVFRAGRLVSQTAVDAGGPSMPP